MKIPIPDDWQPDGEYVCVEIRWPNSPLWIAILTGFLSLPAYGYFWDERSGTITDVQQIGRAIFDLNFPYTNCGECEDCTPEQPDTDGIQCFLASALDDTSEDCMGSLCGYNPKAFKIEGGKLWVRDFCGEWVAIGGVGTTSIATDDTDDPYLPPEIDGGGYSACGKATAVMEMVHGVITSILDEVGNFIWEWWGHVKADNPGVGMDAKWIIIACEGAVNQAAADDAAGEAYDPDALDESTWQSVKCALARDFTDTLPEPLSGNEIRSKLQSYFASEWGVDILTNAIFVDALRGINAESFEDAVILGASYDTSDCDCPSDILGETTPGVDGWYLSAAFDDIDYAVPDDAWAYFNIHEVLKHDIYGVVWEVDYVSGGHKATLKPSNNIGDLTVSYDVMLNGSNSANLALGTMYAAMGPLAYADVFPSGGPTRNVDGVGWSDVIASPVALKNQIALYIVAGQALSAEGDGLWRRYRWRWVHNINSPSHA